MIKEPLKARSTVNDYFDEIIVTIPSVLNFTTTLFMMVWLIGWGFGEYFAITTLFFTKGGGFGYIFMIFWLSFWTYGGFRVISQVIWTCIGKEEITITKDLMKIHLKGHIFSKPISYNKADIKNIRVDDDYENEQTKGVFWKRKFSGTIKFDYGMETVEFANNLYEAEALSILKKILNKRLLSENHFSPNTFSLLL